jgi:hypothetical protein
MDLSLHCHPAVFVAGIAQLHPGALPNTSMFCLAVHQTKVAETLMLEQKMPLVYVHMCKFHWCMCMCKCSVWAHVHMKAQWTCTYAH